MSNHETSRGRKKATPKRWIQISFRTAHIACFSVLVGGHFFDQSSTVLMPWLYASIASGAALVATELNHIGLWLRQLRGIAILLKIALLCVIPLWWDARIAVLAVVIALSSVVSHMPGRYRYWIPGRSLD